MLFVTLALMVVLLLRVAFEWHLYRTEDGKRFQYQVLKPTPELPKKFALWQDEIIDLDFEPLGAFAPSQKSKNTYAWVYVDPTRTICAQIISAPVAEFVSFETRFEDGFALEVSYQYRANINVDQPAIFTANLISSIPETYQYHLHHYDRFEVEHGKAEMWATIEDFLPKPEKHKVHMQGVHASQLQDHLKFAGMFMTFVLSCLLGLFISPIWGAWIGSGLAAIGSGLSLLVLDYEAIAGKFRPVDERKARKEKPVASS
jgi:hypothetical protein